MSARLPIYHGDDEDDAPADNTTPKAVAHALGVSLRTMRRWLRQIAAGESVAGIDAWKIGGRWHVRTRVR